jgi:hypothetical protein
MLSSRSNLLAFIFQTKDISYVCQVQVQICPVLLKKKRKCSPYIYREIQKGSGAKSNEEGLPKI